MIVLLIRVRVSWPPSPTNNLRTKFYWLISDTKGGSTIFIKILSFLWYLRLRQTETTLILYRLWCSYLQFCHVLWNHNLYEHLICRKRKRSYDSNILRRRVLFPFSFPADQELIPSSKDGPYIYKNGYILRTVSSFTRIIQSNRTGNRNRSKMIR